MMAPEYERATLLYAAIDKASYALKRSIDRVDLIDDQIHFRAGAKKLTITYRHVDNYRPGPGSFQLDGEFYRSPEVPKDRPAWYMRSLLLCAAIREATFYLKTGVDRVEVKAGLPETVAAVLPIPFQGAVTCWAGEKQRTMRYRFVAEPGPFGPRRLYLGDEEIAD